MRIDGRGTRQIRPVEVIPGFIEHPEGSVLFSMGKTRVLCSATIEEGVPRWMKLQNIGGGWVTGEYGMLPRATHTRSPRETSGPGGRTQEIRRLIGRSLRAAVDLEKLGPWTITIDCDVLQADGGTRTASITGGYIALALAVHWLIAEGAAPADVLLGAVAAVSTGVIGDKAVLDLCYAEDSTAQVDANIVMNSRGEFIEIQTTAEGKPFKRSMMDEMLALAHSGISELLRIQQQYLPGGGGLK
jgi:ribonuclease PH